MKSIKLKEVPKKIFTAVFRGPKSRGTKEKSKFARKMEPAVKVFNRISLVMHFIMACFVNFVIEAISRHSVREAWDYLTDRPLVFLYNVFLIFITYSIVYLVRRRVFVRLMVTAVWVGLGIANGYMLAKRVTPFNGPDLKNAVDFFTMIDTYLSPFEIVLFVIGVIAVILWLIYMWRNGPKFEGKMRRIIAAIAVAGWFAAYLFVNNLALENRVISNYFGNIAFAFEDYGFPYCFVSSVFSTGISQPTNYSEESINAIVKSTQTDETAEREEDEWPNIIMIQLESVFDPYDIEFLEMSEDPMPTLRRLKEQYSSGYLKVPSVGAGTANTEFEVLTGMNLRYFGPGEYPYKTILQKTTSESVAYNLKELGYSTHAIHNNGGNFYDRVGVFPRLGFDSYTSKEYMNITGQTPNGWSLDDVLVEEIMDSLTSTDDQADFVYCITVQSHGDYPTEQVLADPYITVSGVEDEGERNAWEYYVNQVYEVDKMVADLLEELEALDEPTVLVLFGDHLPTMGLKAEDVASRYLYNTDYIIWDNIGLEKIDQNLTSYQLVSEVMERLDIHEGTIFTYHQSRRKTKNYLVDLEELQYDILYGEKYVYGGENPFEESDMAMGVRTVVIDSVYQNANGDFIIRGENFTKYSKVNVNDERIKSTYIAPNLIQVKDYELEDGDIIIVDQVGSSNTTFSSTEPYYYIAPVPETEPESTEDNQEPEVNTDNSGE